MLDNEYYIDQLMAVLHFFGSSVLAKASAVPLVLLRTLLFAKYNFNGCVCLTKHQIRRYLNPIL